MLYVPGGGTVHDPNVVAVVNGVSTVQLCDDVGFIQYWYSGAEHVAADTDIDAIWPKLKVALFAGAVMWIVPVHLGFVSDTATVRPAEVAVGVVVPCVRTVANTCQVPSL